MTKKKKEITIIDYGMGNLFNVVRAFESINCDVNVTNNINEIMKNLLEKNNYCPT